MSRTKEFYNDINGQEFISKDYLVGRAYKEINSNALILRDFIREQCEEDWYIQFHRTCAVIHVFANMNFINDDLCSAMINGLAVSLLDNFIPQIDRYGNIYFV